MEVDGRDYERRRRSAAFGSALKAVREVNGLAMTFYEARYPERHQRTLIMGPGRFLLVLDWIGDKDAHDYRQWFQLAPEWQAHRTNGSISAVCEDLSLCVHNLVEEAAFSPIWRGSKEPMQGWISRAANKLTPSPSFCLEQRGATARVATLFCLSGHVEIKKASLNATLSKGDIRWISGRRRYVLRFHRDGTELDAILE